MGMIDVDIGRSAHYAVGLDDDGKRLIARAVANRQRDIDDLVSWAAKHDACVVVDQPNGGVAALIQTCWDRGVPVGYLHGVGDGACEGLLRGRGKDRSQGCLRDRRCGTHPSVAHRCALADPRGTSPT